jgi:hypothetical protein
MEISVNQRNQRMKESLLLSPCPPPASLPDERNKSRHQADGLGLAVGGHLCGEIESWLPMPECLRKLLYGIEAVYGVYAVGQAEKMPKYQAKIEFRNSMGEAVTCGHMRSIPRTMLNDE